MRLGAVNVHNNNKTYYITYRLTSFLLAAAMAFSKIDLKREWKVEEEWEEEGSPE